MSKLKSSTSHSELVSGLAKKNKPKVTNRPLKSGNIDAIIKKGIANRPVNSLGNLSQYKPFKGQKYSKVSFVTAKGDHILAKYNLLSRDQMLALSIHSAVYAIFDNLYFKRVDL